MIRVRDRTHIEPRAKSTSYQAHILHISRCADTCLVLFQMSEQLFTSLQKLIMKSVIILGLMAVGIFAAPVMTNTKAIPRAYDYEDDAFRYSDNINNAVDVAERRRTIDYEDDAFRYTDNIDNAVDLEIADRRRDVDYEDDAFRYTDNIDNASDIVERRAHDYEDNLDKKANVKKTTNPAKLKSWEHIVTDADGTKVLLTSPYADDVRAATRLEVLGE
ncbi:hypothetical protein GGR57DRAFT_477617 [Xylariaceae sp. FL1272]|nr:hypothetical protein GGR57DRAFT_477617 [Xylariaceae sp. FL1272]